jgi:hypothetical protein
MTAGRAPITEVAAGLRRVIGDVARALFPAGRIEGREFVVGSVAGEAGQSLRIQLFGQNQGLWCEFADGSGGDALDLVAQVLFGGDRGEAWRWGCDFLGLDGAPAAPLPKRPAAPPDPAGGIDSGVRRRESAIGLWLAASPVLRGSPVDAYLQGRGIRLAGLGRQPAAIRYHPELAFEGGFWPAMVALICGTGEDDGRAIGIHRTFLQRLSWGGVIKAPLGDPPGSAAKRMLGGSRGGLIPIWRGASGKPMRLAPDGETLAIAEGIEDGLTVAIARPDWRVAAALSAGNLAQLALPKAIATVVLCADNDAAGSPAAKALDKAIARFNGEGRRVLVARAPAGSKDFNALLLNGGEAA